jgi:hypothetical protein
MFVRPTKTARAHALERLRQLQLEREAILATYPELRDTHTPRRSQPQERGRAYVARRRSARTPMP